MIMGFWLLLQLCDICLMKESKTLDIMSLHICIYQVGSRRTATSESAHLGNDWFTNVQGLLHALPRQVSQKQANTGSAEVLNDNPFKYAMVKIAIQWIRLYQVIACISLLASCDVSFILCIL
jgi:hypothetical protein